MLDVYLGFLYAMLLVTIIIALVFHFSNKK